MAEEPVGVLGVFALLLHQPHKRAPLVDGTADVLDLLVENVEAFARGWHGPAIRTGGYLVPGHPLWEWDTHVPFPSSQGT